MIKFNKNVSKHDWMPCPDVDLRYPGLAYIYPLDELIIAKQRDEYHDIIGDNTSTAYTIFNKDRQKVFIAVERSKCQRTFLKIFNHYGNEVIQVEKPFKWFKPCKNKALVWSPPGNFVGVVREYKRCVHTFGVKNWSGAIIFVIKAKGTKSYEYAIRSKNGIVGKVVNNWTGLDVKNFGVSFPDDMNVMDKAVLLGACFLISWLRRDRKLAITIVNA